MVKGIVVVVVEVVVNIVVVDVVVVEGREAVVGDT